MFYYLQMRRHLFTYETSFASVQHVGIRYLFVIIARLQSRQYSVSMTIQTKKSYLIL